MFVKQSLDNILKITFFTHGPKNRNFTVSLSKWLLFVASFVADWKIRET